MSTVTSLDVFTLSLNSDFSYPSVQANFGCILTLIVNDLRFGFVISTTLSSRNTNEKENLSTAKFRLESSDETDQ